MTSKFYIILEKYQKLYEGKKKGKKKKDTEDTKEGSKKPKGGKMKDLLKIPEDKKIEDVYDDPKKLADDLVAATNAKKAKAMLTFLARVKKGNQLFDKAAKSIK